MPRERGKGTSKQNFCIHSKKLYYKSHNGPDFVLGPKMTWVSKANEVPYPRVASSGGKREVEVEVEDNKNYLLIA